MSLRDEIERNLSLPAPADRLAIRRAAGISRRLIAEELEVTPESVRNWELGLARPSSRHLRDYLEILELLRSASQDRAA